MAMASDTSHRGRRVFLYGCGVVAPGAAHLDEFLAGVWAGRSSLSPDPELYDAFLTGRPKFDFQRYRDWFTSRHAPARFAQLEEKAEENVQFALGATVDALAASPGLEDALRKLDDRVRIVFGSSFGELAVAHRSARQWDAAVAEWDAFWADPERNGPCADHLAGRVVCDGVPPDPRELPADSFARAQAWRVWNGFWARKSSSLAAYLRAAEQIEGACVGEDVARSKLHAMRARAQARRKLNAEYGCPIPPWDQGMPNVVWNLPNAPAAQVSMALELHGPALSLNGACAAFGVLVKDALDAIRSGSADAVILGTVDETPSPELVSAFFAGRVGALGQNPSVPLCDLRGTHLAGGSAVWIVMAEDAAARFGLAHLGVEVLGAGVSSDAEHIITPSEEGPKLSIRAAMQDAGVRPPDIGTWDMHATGTPGDPNEFGLLEDLVPRTAVITARKGLWGHGMGVSGGWELTAQVLCARRDGDLYWIPGSGIPSDRVHGSIRQLGWQVALDKPMSVQTGERGLVTGKLGMGVGGLASCVFCRINR